MNYLDLLKLALTGALNTYGEYKPKFFKGEVFRWWSLLYWLDIILRRFGYNICTYTPYDVEKRINGQDHPMYADTMCGGRRLTTIAWITKEVISNRVKGDFLMAGAWRGGAAIYMKALLKYFFDKRFVFVADSFAGLPKPTLKEDKGDTLWQVGYLAVDLETVRANFRKYDLLDKSVVFLKGWFKDTLPILPTDNLAFIYADGDMYESTMDILNNCYHKLQPGGYIVIDDYHTIAACKMAVDEFRAAHNIEETIHNIDLDAVYWCKKNDGIKRFDNSYLGN